MFSMKLYSRSKERCSARKCVKGIAICAKTRITLFRIGFKVRGSFKCRGHLMRKASSSKQAQEDRNFCCVVQVWFSFWGYNTSVKMLAPVTLKQQLTKAHGFTMSYSKIFKKHVRIPFPHPPLSLGQGSSRHPNLRMSISSVRLRLQLVTLACCRTSYTCSKNQNSIFCRDKMPL